MHVQTTLVVLPGIRHVGVEGPGPDGGQEEAAAERRRGACEGQSGARPAAWLRRWGCLSPSRPAAPLSMCTASRRPTRNAQASSLPVGTHVGVQPWGGDAAVLPCACAGWVRSTAVRTTTPARTSGRSATRRTAQMAGAGAPCAPASRPGASRARCSRSACCPPEKEQSLW